VLPLQYVREDDAVKARWAILLIAGLLWPRVGWAQGPGFDDVLVTRHNLFPGGPEAEVRDVCLICHVEHIEDTSPRMMATLLKTSEVELSSLKGEATTEQTPEGLKITISEKVLFDFDHYDLKPTAIFPLQKIAKILMESPGVEVVVTGHTDDVGTDAYNQRLSERRAEAVKNRLILEGTATDRLLSLGLGERFPKVSNDTPEGREQNRRVDLLLKPAYQPAPVQQEPPPPAMEQRGMLQEVASPDLIQQATPLWDPRSTTQLFLPLPRVLPPFGKGGPDHRPFGPSFNCLACHDGALGNDVHQLGFASGRGEARSQEMISAREGPRSPDHPDSILYPRKPTGELIGHRADPNLLRYWSIPDRDEGGMTIPTGPKSTNLGLQDIDASDPAQTTGLVRTFLGVIHCDTCHNPHLDQNRPFLRLPTQNLCLSCHQR